jgi:hypothetical protein
MRTKTALLIVALGALTLLATNAVADTVTTYNSQSAWAAATTGITTIDFATLNPPAGSLILYPSPPGLTVDGVNFSDPLGGPVSVIDTGFCCATYNRGFDTVDTGAGQSMTVTLPSGTTSVGFYVYAVAIGDVNGLNTENVDFGVAGNTYTITTPTLASTPNSAFFGFVDSSPVSSFTVTPESSTVGVDLMLF